VHWAGIASGAFQMQEGREGR